MRRPRGAAQVDALLRRKDRALRPELTLAAFVALLEKHHCTLAWPRNLATELGRRGDLNRLRTFAECMETVRDLVQAAGWPGRRQLSATEFEATRAWESALDLLATLDYSGKRVTLETALTMLQRQIQYLVLSPPTHNAPVQIMTPAEAEGSRFDAVLFLRATDANWPAAEHTHPLLSWQMQSALRMPGTDPARSAAKTRAFTQALLERVPEVLFTSAAADADGHLRPSPLLRDLTIGTVEAEALVSTQRDHAAIAYDLVVDDTPLPALRTVAVHGGATLLKLQAACGFQAFAQLRLQAAGPESSQIGLDAAESGTLVHKVLHLFWRQVEDRATLESLSEEQRRKTLLQCIDQAIAGEVRQLESAWDKAYVQMVRDRLLKLLMQWLDCELERSPFRVISTEQEETIDVGPLTLKVKMDRIDSVPNSDGSFGASTLTTRPVAPPALRSGTVNGPMSLSCRCTRSMPFRRT